VVPSQFAWAVPELPATELVCVEPTTVVLAALRRLRMPLPDSALVVGVGAQGLTMTLALIERGVTTFVTDINPSRVALATELGAKPAETDHVRGFGLIVDAAGAPSSMKLALDRAEPGATVLCLGLDSRPLDLTTQTLVRRQLTLQGSLTYDHPGDFEAAIDAIVGGQLYPGRIVTNEHTLEDAQAAFDRSGSAAGKTWIRVAG
jgi:alcohol dehydrogenase/L-iditol 2-dehydrogenase